MNRQLVIAFVLFFCLGLTPWLIVNSIWVELPLIAQVVPEGYSIVASLSVGLQVSNFVAFLFVWFTKDKTLNYTFPLSFVLILAFLVTIFLGLFWDQTVQINEKHYSVSLYILNWFAGVVGCLSVVVFYPAVSVYTEESFTGVLSAGMAFNAIVAAFLGFIQSPAETAYWSVSINFYLLSFVIFLSMISLYLIVRLPFMKRFHDTSKQEPASPTIVNDERKTETQSVLAASDNSNFSISTISTKSLIMQGLELMLIQFFICILNYFILSVLPYSVMSFEDSNLLYTWMNRSGLVFGALSRLVCAVPKFRFPYLRILCGLAFLFWIPLVLAAFIPTNSIHVSFGWILVVINILFTTLYGYLDSLVFMQVSSVFLEKSKKERGSRLVSFANQLGAFVGSVASFLVVEFYLEEKYSY